MDPRVTGTHLLRAALAALALVVVSGVAAAVEDPEPVSIRLVVIEASQTPGYDPKLGPLKDAIVGYAGAKVIDELETKVERKASVSLDIINRSRSLRVTVLDVQPDGTVRLKVEIEAFKFATTTTHKKGNATVVVAHKTGPDKALFLAVTPKI